MEMETNLTYPDLFCRFDKVPENLVFDDEPLEPLLLGNVAAEPTPVNVLVLWQRGGAMQVDCVEAVAAILARQPELSAFLKDQGRAEKLLRKTLAQAEKEGSISRIVSLLLALARLLQVNNRLADAEIFYRRAVVIQRESAGPSHESTLEILKNLADLMEGKGNKLEAAAIRRGAEIERLFARGSKESLVDLRSMALDLYVNGLFQEAEDIYRRLLQKGFEVPGTCTHLARVLIMADRETEARQIMKTAWQEGYIAPAYVRPRILFLTALLDLLEGGDIAFTIGQLKSALAKGDAFLEWTISPVLDHLQPRLGPDNLALLKALADALNSRDQLPVLDDQFQAWREQPLVPL